MRLRFFLFSLKGLLEKYCYMTGNDFWLRAAAHNAAAIAHLLLRGRAQLRRVLQRRMPLWRRHSGGSWRGADGISVNCSRRHGSRAPGSDAAVIGTVAGRRCRLGRRFAAVRSGIGATQHKGWSGDARHEGLSRGAQRRPPRRSGRRRRRPPAATTAAVVALPLRVEALKGPVSTGASSLIPVLADIFG